MIALRRLQPLVRSSVWLAAEVTAVVALTGLGSRTPFTGPNRGWDAWLATAAPADVLVASLRWAALLGAWWLLATTVLYVAASMTRVPGAVRAVRWAALPAVRRTVDAVFAVSLLAGSVLAPTAARAAPADATATTVRNGRSGGLASLPAATATTAVPVSTPPPPPARAPAPAPAAVVVRPGDNLWELAARQLATASGRARVDVPDSDIAPYWLAVCDQNRDALTSRDPNVIQPGEIVTFPVVGVT